MFGFGGQPTPSTPAERLAQATGALLRLAPQLGSYIQDAVKRYGDMRAAGLDVSPDLLTTFLEAKMASWDPEVGGRKVLDSKTKAAGARFLAGVTFNIVSDGGGS